MVRERKLITAHTGIIDPLKISTWEQAGGYKAISKALSMDQEAVTELIKQAGLRGRGGAGFPTWIKIKSVYDAKCREQKFLVCNADEGEPGTFKDKLLMETNPHQLIEGMLIAAYAAGASAGFIYVRGEYRASIKTLKQAVTQAQERGYLGKNICGSDFNFQLEILPGAGSYLCGEELTLIESLEGKRGHPRIKPPFPAHKGLWLDPTLVNNVETLSCFPYIINKGAADFAAMGTEKSKGTKLVCLSGDVVKPGVYEVEMGTPVLAIINDLGGGVKQGHELHAALLGGAAGTFANASRLNTPLCYDQLTGQNLTLGSGAIIVFGPSFSLYNTLLSILRFFKHESCGKCVPCRIGTYHLYHRWDQAQDVPASEKMNLLKSLTEESKRIAATSLCPLGQSPALPLASALNNISHLL